MAWGFSGTRWSGGYAPSITDSALIAADIQTAGGHRDSGKYGLPNTAFVTLVPGALPGITYTVTAASWAASVATITIGAHAIQVGQHFSLAGVTPAGYNGADLVATATTGTTVSYALTSNPGAWSSGGTVLVSGVSGANGMLAVDANGALNQYNSGWGGLKVVSLVPNVGIGMTPFNPLDIQATQSALRGGQGLSTMRLVRSAGTKAASFSISGAVAADPVIGCNPSSDDLIFGYDNGTSFTERMRLVQSNGFFGIGMTPHAPLAVSGLPSYANNAAAISGGLTAGDFYVVTSSNPRQVAVVF